MIIGTIVQVSSAPSLAPSPTTGRRAAWPRDPLPVDPSEANIQSSSVSPTPGDPPRHLPLRQRAHHRDSALHRQLQRGLPALRPGQDRRPDPLESQASNHFRYSTLARPVKVMAELVASRSAFCQCRRFGEGFNAGQHREDRILQSLQLKSYFLPRKSQLAT